MTKEFRNRPPGETLRGATTVEQVKPQLTEEGLLPDDQLIFDEVKRITGLSKDEDRYWRVRDAIRDSREREVDHELDRWFGSRLRGTVGSPLEEVLKPVRRRGWISQVVSWLESATVKGMKYGRRDFTREMRIAEAKKLAQKAGVTLQEIIETHNLQLGFNIIEE